MRDPHGLVGTTLDRRYAVTRVVAEGGFGVVYRGDVLAWIEGETLDARIRRLGPASPRGVIELLAPVVAAIAYAHDQGVVHRDLKPGNVMVVESASGPRTRVLDFGVARWTSTLGVAT